MSKAAPAWLKRILFLAERRVDPQLAQLPGYIPYQVAGCHTYRALGLDVWTSYCRGGVSAEGAVCDAVMAADAASTINLECVAIGGEPLTAPRFLSAWAWVAAVGTAFAVGYGAGRHLARRSRRR